MKTAVPLLLHERILNQIIEEEDAYYRAPVRITVSPGAVLQMIKDAPPTIARPMKKAAEAGIAGLESTLYNIPLWIDASVPDDEARLAFSPDARRFDERGTPQPPPL